MQRNSLPCAACLPANEGGVMLTKHEAVGGTGFIVTDDDGKVLIAATLVEGEQEGLFVALLLEYLTLRAPASVRQDRQSSATVLPLHPRRSLRTATPG